MKAKYIQSNSQRQIWSQIFVEQPNESVRSRSPNVYIRFEATLPRYLVQVVQVPSKRVAFAGGISYGASSSLFSASAYSSLLSIYIQNGLDIRCVVVLKCGNGR